MIEENVNYHLHPYVKIVWGMNVFLLYLAVWLVASFAIIKLNIPFLGFPPGMAPFVLLVVFALLLIPYLLWLEMEWKHFVYSLGKTELHIRKGVIRIENYVVPYEKIQNINVERNLLERMLGIATIKIETAGTNPWEAEITLPGIADYKALVSYILKKVETSKHGIEETPEEEGVFDRIISDISKFGMRLDNFEERLGVVERRIDEISEEVSSIKDELSALHEKIDALLSVKTESSGKEKTSKKISPKKKSKKSKKKKK